MTDAEVQALLRDAEMLMMEREWCTGQLAIDESERSISIFDRELRRYTGFGGGVGSYEKVSCSEVWAMCAYGSIEIASVCDSFPDDVSRTTAVAKAARFVSRAILRLYPSMLDRHYDSYLENLYDDPYDEPVAEERAVWEKRVLEDPDAELNSGDGVIPEWNDEMAKSKDEVLSVLREAQLEAAGV